MIGKKFLQSVAKKAVNVGEEISQEAHDAAKFVSKNTVKVGEKLGEAATQAVGAVTDNLWGNESTGWDLAKLPEEQRLAFYGALFAIASADGHFDKDEMDLICGVMDLEEMSDHAKEEIQEYIIEPHQFI